MSRPATPCAPLPGERLRTIRLYGALGTKFGREYRLWVKTPAEAVQALTLQLKGMEAFMLGERYSFAVLVGKRRLKLRDNLEELRDPPGDDVIRIVPLIVGAKRGGLFQAVIGAVLIAAAFIPGGQPLATLGAKMMFSAGVSLVLGGVAAMLSPQPKMNIADSPDNRASHLFNGPVNTVAQGNGVPIFYGCGIVGSSVISAGITAVDTYPGDTA